MKKNILLLLISLIAVGNYAHAQNNRKPFVINIVIAKPKFNCEYGLGICKISAGYERRVGVGLNIEKGVLVFTFDRTTMPDAIQQEFSQSTHFPIDEASRLEPEVWQKLGERVERTLKTGNYRIQTSPESFVVRVPLE